MSVFVVVKGGATFEIEPGVSKVFKEGEEISSEELGAAAVAAYEDGDAHIRSLVKELSKGADTDVSVSKDASIVSEEASEPTIDEPFEGYSDLQVKEIAVKLDEFVKAGDIELVDAVKDYESRTRNRKTIVTYVVDSK